MPKTHFHPSRAFRVVPHALKDLETCVASLVRSPARAATSYGYSGKSEGDFPAAAPSGGCPVEPKGFNRSVLERIRSKFGDFIHRAASENGLGVQGERLITAVMMQESKGNPDAQSPKGALGLMQLMPGTGKENGVSPEDRKDAQANIEAGARYLKKLHDQFHGDVALVAAAYNAGPGAVERYGGVPPYAETQRYVENVLGNFLAISEG